MPQQRAALALAELHDRADELARREDRGAHLGLAHLGDLAAGELAGVGHGDLGAVVHRHLVDDVGLGRDELEVELALEPLADDLEVQQAEEAAPEAEAQRHRRLRLVDERGVVELELVEGLAQVGVVGAVEREQPREDHRLGVAVAAEGGAGGLDEVGHRVADPALAHVLHAGDEVAHLADAQALARHRLGADDADLEQLVGGPGRHHDDALARVEVAVDDPHVGDHAAVGVVDRVEDHRAGRGVGVARRRRDLPDDLVEQRLDARRRSCRTRGSSPRARSRSAWRAPRRTSRAGPPAGRSC